MFKIEKNKFILLPLYGMVWYDTVPEARGPHVDAVFKIFEIPKPRRITGLDLSSLCDLAGFLFFKNGLNRYMNQFPIIFYTHQEM